MHPYFVTSIADDHRARLAAEAEPSVCRAERSGRGWRQWLRPFLHADGRPTAVALPVRAATPHLAPVLVMAPPFPPGAHGPRPGASAAQPPFDLAS
jgi:hypothetical protein